MPDTGQGSRASSHVSTAQWQSFELRMRKRRAERLTARAEAALAQGQLSEAREALEEARALDPSSPDLEALQARLPVPAAAVAAVPIVVPAAYVEAANPVASVDIRPAAPEPVMFEPAAVVFEPRPAMFEPRSRSFSAPLAIAASVILAAVTAVAAWIRFGSTPAIQPADEPAHAAISEPRPTAPPGAVPALATSGTDVTVPAKPEQPADETTADATPAFNEAPVAAEPPKREETPAVPVGTERSLPSSTVPAPIASVEPLTETTAPPTEPPTRDGIDSGIPIAAPPPVAPVVETPPPAPRPERVDESSLVRRVLSQYEAAYSTLDARAAQRVWPTLDAHALSRAFDGLQSQHVSLGTCNVALTSAGARAECRGSAEWTPKVGGGTRTEARRWSFDLRKTDGQWRIIDATVR